MLDNKNRSPTPDLIPANNQRNQRKGQLMVAIGFHEVHFMAASLTTDVIANSYKKDPFTLTLSKDSWIPLI